MQTLTLSVSLQAEVHTEMPPDESDETDAKKEAAEIDKSVPTPPPAAEESVGLEVADEEEDIDPAEEFEFQRLSLEDKPDEPSATSTNDQETSNRTNEEPGPSSSAVDDANSQSVTSLPVSAPAPSAPLPNPAPTQPQQPLYADPDTESDGEGEWITPANVGAHKSRASSSFFTDKSKKKKNEAERPIGVACMTADFAMQNVLFHMGVDLVSVEGKRVTSVKTWVLRCHACFK